MDRFQYTAMASKYVTQIMRGEITRAEALQKMAEAQRDVNPPLHLTACEDNGHGWCTKHGQLYKECV